VSSGRSKRRSNHLREKGGLGPSTISRGAKDWGKKDATEDEKNDEGSSTDTRTGWESLPLKRRGTRFCLTFGVGQKLAGNTGPPKKARKKAPGRRTEGIPCR